MSYIVDLETFHGPLDLLLYLVEKNEVDIYDIPLALITEQYIDYLQTAGKVNLEMLGDFLLVASYLLNLKSQTLLPRVQDNEEEVPPEDYLDPREELVQKLLDYKKYKQAAQDLVAMQEGDFNRVFYRETIHEITESEEVIASLNSLVRAYKRVLEGLTPLEEGYLIPRDDVSVEEKMTEILQCLRGRTEGLLFQDLFAPVVYRREALALFLALLELIRLRQVQAIQKTDFSEIRISLWVGNANVNA